uniref:ABC transporter domain-containing protein n=1 Tax=Gasterosteus aculeatus aculeatus TaxID=481459 RepID=A0AAQ4PY41_GASAC
FRRRWKMSKTQEAMELGLNGASKHQVPSCAGRQRQGATVSFHNIEYKVVQGGSCLCRKKGTTKDILVDLNGAMAPGLNAIMGATGSGKSSFLDVLAARKDPAGLSGEVLIDGAHQPANFKCLSGYVVQDDVVMGTLTVRENFRFSAALRLPASVGTQLIRGISGGERKRTNIGMELIIDPPVLFLDEPTTGLDASTASSVLLLLKRMANSGRTIILSIHQPRYSIYRLFDSLTLLVNGKQVFHGPAHSALEYFSNIGYTCEPHNNPADFFLDIINGDSTAVALNSIDREDTLTKSRRGIEEKLVREYKGSIFFQQTKAELDRIIQGKQATTTAPSRTITYNTGFLTQFRWVLKRTFRNLMLNPQTSIAQIGVTLFLALVVGAIFFDVKDDQSGIQNSCDRRVTDHEYISGYYRVSVYFLSKILSDIITLRTIPAMTFSCVAYFMIGLKPTAAAFFTFMFTVTLVAYTATAMALAISADQTVVAIANIFMTIACVFMMIFAGLLVNLPSIVSWLSWLQYLSIPRYGLGVRTHTHTHTQEVNEFTGLDFCGGSNSSAAPPGLK